MKKIVMSFSLIIAGLGFATMSQQAYGMDTKTKKNEEILNNALKTKVVAETLKFAEKALIQANKFIDEIPARYKTKVCIGAAVVGVSGLAYASYEAIKTSPKIFLVTAVSAGSLYLAYRTFPSGNTVS